MEKEEIGTESPFTVAEVTLVPIVKTWLKCWHRKGYLSFIGIKQPLGIVVVSAQTRRAFRANGEEVSLEQLTKEVPGIEETLEGL